MKVSSKIYKGIEYVQIKDLPKEQQETILDTLNHECLIKILIDRSIISNCIQYKDYVLWFDSIYDVVRSTAQKQEHTLETSPIQLSFGKA
jgi:hypothetical protein